MSSEYAQAGVDYQKIQPFKDAMVKVARRTINFPNCRGVYLNQDVVQAHGAVYYCSETVRHLWCKTQEGLGNKNWIAEWMYQHAGTGRTYYEGIGIDTGLMAVNDALAQGAVPVVYADEVAAGDSEWFEDDMRSRDLAESYFKLCQMVGMALGAGESPSLRYLIKAEPPVKSAPSLSGCVTSLIAPVDCLITGEKLRAGDHIIGAPSSGLHANGISLIIKRALTLSDQFLTKLPNGNTLGDEALIPTRSYVALVEALLEGGATIHAILPGTGDGVAKLAFDKRPFTYRINTWVDVPILFQFMQEIGVSLEDCLTTFNWGIGYYLFVPPKGVDHVISIGARVGYDLVDLGLVEEGERQVIFGPAGDLVLPPPGE